MGWLFIVALICVVCVLAVGGLVLYADAVLLGLFVWFLFWVCCFDLLDLLLLLARLLLN